MMGTIKQTALESHRKLRKLGLKSKGTKTPITATEISAVRT